MSQARTRAVEGRNDLSRFVIHLTRDDRADADDRVHGQRAELNFRGIIDSRKILALRPHCLHAEYIPDEHRERFSVCCFTEVPLSELHLLTRPIDGRRTEASPRARHETTTSNAPFATGASWPSSRDFVSS